MLLLIHLVYMATEKISIDITITLFKFDNNKIMKIT